MGSSSLIPKLVEYKVSSVLNNDRKVYGKQFLFDGRDETCWNSDTGLPQWIQFKFNGPVTIHEISIQFQGGFVGKECELRALDLNESESQSFFFGPEDINSVQKFQLGDKALTGKTFKLIFKTSSDFYGRIIIYNADIIGE